MKTVKLSYSILKAWERGDYEQAVGMYLGDPLPATPYMELGKIKHQVWANYTQRNNALHPELGGHSLTGNIVEQKYQKLIYLSDDIQILLRGVIDLETTLPQGQVIIDYKCGKTRSGAYLSAEQLDYYSLLRPQATEGRYITHNPYLCKALCGAARDGLVPHKCYGVGVKFLGVKNRERAVEHIITFGSAMIDYLQTQRLLRDFDIEMDAARQRKKTPIATSTAQHELEQDLMTDESVIEEGE